ncbi:MAG: hypothetical protein AAGA64_16435, partial [Bacteroidota bacterium]
VENRKRAPQIKSILPAKRSKPNPLCLPTHEPRMNRAIRGQAPLLDLKNFQVSPNSVESNKTEAIFISIPSFPKFKLAANCLALQEKSQS